MSKSTDHKKQYEKYLDPTHNREYYFDPETNESIWELPEGTTDDQIIDRT